MALAETFDEYEPTAPKGRRAAKAPTRPRTVGLLGRLNADQKVIAYNFTGAITCGPKAD